MPDPDSNALVVERLEVRFGGNVVLADLSFAVRAGVSLAIIGPNGAGKTVLFQALIGALPHGGTITWRPGTRVGYVPQKLDLEPGLPLTGRDFLNAKSALVRAGRDDVDAALRTVGLSEASARASIGSLSGGQFQRLLVAAALVGNPDALLLDEATAGVDEPGQDTLYETIDRLRAARGLTVLFISHDLSVVYRHADTVLCLAAHGRACVGAPRTVLSPAMLQELYGAPVAFHTHDDAPRS